MSNPIGNAATRHNQPDAQNPKLRTRLGTTPCNIPGGHRVTYHSPSLYLTRQAVGRETADTIGAHPVFTIAADSATVGAPPGVHDRCSSCMLSDTHALGATSPVCQLPLASTASPLVPSFLPWRCSRGRVSSASSDPNPSGCTCAGPPNNTFAPAPPN